MGRRKDQIIFTRKKPKAYRRKKDMSKETLEREVKLENFFQLFIPFELEKPGAVRNDVYKKMQEITEDYKSGKFDVDVETQKLILIKLMRTNRTLLGYNSKQIEESITKKLNTIEGKIVPEAKEEKPAEAENKESGRTEGQTSNS